jgi:hypothetical protein
MKTRSMKMKMMNSNSNIINSMQINTCSMTMTKRRMMSNSHKGYTITMERGMCIRFTLINTKTKKRTTIVINNKMKTVINTKTMVVIITRVRKMKRKRLSAKTLFFKLHITTTISFKTNSRGTKSMKKRSLCMAMMVPNNIITKIKAATKTSTNPPCLMPST